MYQDYEGELDRAYGVLGSFQYFRLLKVELLQERLTGWKEEKLRILDLGAGDGTMLGMLSSKFERFGLEPDAEMIEQRVDSTAEACFMSASGAALPLKDESFDVIFASCVFHHMASKDIRACLADSLRVLRPGGRLFVFEHNTYNLAIVAFLKLFVAIDREAVFLSPREMLRLVKDAGFPVTSWSYFCFLPGFLARFRALERALTWLPLGGQYCFEARKGQASS